jgi:hypothetical protein
MAKVAAKPKPRSFEQRLKDVLAAGLDVAGIEAEITTEPIRGTKLRRVLVIAEGFENLRPSERQDLVWRIVSQQFDNTEQLRISMILTLTPQEMRGER